MHVQPAYCNKSPIFVESLITRGEGQAELPWFLIAFNGFTAFRMSSGSAALPNLMTIANGSPRPR